jgi:hypothetical protein
MLTSRQALERERDQLRSFRVAARKKIERLAYGRERIGSVADTDRAINMLKHQLLSAEQRADEITRTLRADAYNTARDRAVLAVQAKRSAQRRMSSGYITKVMVPDR